MGTYSKKLAQNNRVVREGGTSHVMMDRRAIEHGETGGAVRQQARALRGADFLAQVGFRVKAVFALAALWRVKRDNVIAHFKAGHTLAHFNHDARALMAEDRREDALRIIARTGELIRVAQAGRLDFDQDLSRARAFQIDLHNFKRFSSGNGNGGFSAHVVVSQFVASFV